MTTANSQNLNAHYTTNVKVSRPENPVAIPPQALPTQHLYNDIDAKRRMNSINQDVYDSYKKEEKRDGNNFLKIFGISSATVLGVLGLKELFKK